MTELDELVTAVLASPKYRDLAPELVRRIGARELAARRSFKEAVKATKNKLHQVGGAYFETRIDYGRAAARLRQAAGDEAAWRAACRELMRLHASTRERLPILDGFYGALLADVPPARSVLDVACGLNPLTWPWLPAAPGAVYQACDIYGDLMAFVAEFMALAGLAGTAEVRDVIGRPPDAPVDLALLLKLLPVLEQVDRTAVPRLLDTLRARVLLISFPVASLGGRHKGMVESYDAQFAAWAAGRDWTVRRVELETELVFRVVCGDGAASP